MTRRKGWAVWITGLPSSGKSTIAKALKRGLEERDFDVQILESDELRRILTPSPSYTEEERDTFYGALVYIGELLINNGVNVIFDATANKRRYRDEARRRIKRFLEVYVKCPLEVCIARDVKGIYRQALKGEASTVPGLQSSYEEPLKPDVTTDSTRESPEKAAHRIIGALRERGFLEE
jgi:adenylylsulfate kinase